VKNKKKIFRIISCAVFIGGIFLSPLFAQDVKFPSQPEGYVNDYAGLLTAADKKAISKLALELEEKTTAQLAVVTLKTVRPETIEGYAVKLFQKWGIGQKGKDNGILLLIVINDREVRIETGYGLEGALPDVICNKIIQNIIIPNFKSQNYSKGIHDGAYAVINLVAKEYNVQITGGESTVYNNLHEEQNVSSDILGLIVWLVIIILLFSSRLWPWWFLLGGMGGRGGYWYGGGGGFGGGFGGGSGGFGGGFSGGGGASGRW